VHACACMWGGACRQSTTCLVKGWADQLCILCLCVWCVWCYVRLVMYCTCFRFGWMLNVDTQGYFISSSPAHWI
jgi:hypothetical protein